MASFNDNGFVLRPARTATGNAQSTGEATNGVPRDHKDLPGSYDTSASAVEVFADQYRAAVLDNIEGEAEYLVWAARTGSLTLLDGQSISIDGDTIESPQFWWTRNDEQMTRFGWNGTTQRWEPFKGQAPVNLGVLTEPIEFQLAPRPTRFIQGQTLPRGGGDHYALLRAGSRPDNSSIQLEVIVVADGDIDSGAVDFGTLGDPDAVLEETSGKLLLNDNAANFDTLFGLTLWYIPEDFREDNTGDVGELLGSDVEPLFIAPIPGPTDYPLIRIGSRRHLTAIPVANDTDLDATAVASGEVAWAQTTGRLKFNQADIDQADPTHGSFDARFVDARVYYDGYAMCSEPLGLPDPVQLKADGGDLYIPLAAPLPAPGTSGVVYVPDGTGTPPDPSVTPSTRPNGSGLVREIESVGEVVVWASNGTVGEDRVFVDVRVVEFEDDLPKLSFKVPQDTIYIAREEGSSGSRVQFRRQGLGNHDLYFRQSYVIPGTVVNTTGLDPRLDATPRMYSRRSGLFTPDKTELLPFYIDGVAYVWDASTLPAPSITPLPGQPDRYTAEEIAASIDAILPGAGVEAQAVRDHVVLVGTTSVEIGLGVDGGSPSGDLEHRSTSGQALLGFLPGWRVEVGELNWLPDNGSALGLYRSPLNKDRSRDIPDFKHLGRLENEILTENVGQSPLFILPTSPPLRDLDGFGVDEFFQVINGTNLNTLSNLTEVYYDFAFNRFGWLETDRVTVALERETAFLPLGNNGVIPATMDNRVVPGNGLSVSEDGTAWSLLTRDEGYLTPGNGVQGIAALINRVGGIQASGTDGTAVTAGSFRDTTTSYDFTGATEGYILKVLAGPNQGSYRVTNVVDADTIEVSPAFSDITVEMVWELFSGYPEDTFDDAIVADVQYERFNHLPEETFSVRLLSSAGTVGGALAAIPTEALQSGREIGVRFGQPNTSPSATLRVLTRGVNLGTLSNGGLAVPDILDDHFTTGAFEIRVGATPYTPTLAVWVDGDPAPAGDVVQYRADGVLRFGDAVFASYQGANVYYDEIALDPVDLAAGAAELNPNDGVITLSAADAASYVGETAYFVERLISESQQDVFLSPLSGSFFLNRPAREGQLVEASYFQANTDGTKKNDTEITEFLPVYIRLEQATRLSATVYQVNAAGRTVAPIDTQVWVDGELQNWGNLTTATFDPNDSTVTFSLPLDVSAVVQVNYAVYEATGGEQAYSTSTKPVWRPPFYLDEGQNTYTFDTDRTGDLVPGKLLRLGAVPLYIKSATYDAAEDTTEVVFYPTPTGGVGSKAPGSDVLALLTSEVVALDVDGVSTAGREGFLGTHPGTYEPVSKGSRSIIFHGDLTEIAIPGYMLEIDGDPYLIAGRTLSDDGRTTEVDLTSTVTRSYLGATVRLSRRPIYPPQPTEFLGVGPFLEDEPFELILFGETNFDGTEKPGRTLVRDIDYTTDPGDGTITLLPPVQAALSPGQSLVFHHTKLNALSPFVQDGAVLFPRFRAQYGHLVTPSDANGYLGATLVASYSFNAPDSFYYRTVSLETYAGEVNRKIIERLQGRSSQGGPVISAPGAIRNYEQGSLGLLSQLRDLKDQDRAARAFLTFYNETIISFEQVLETISGGIVGDRDGKFRFFVGTGKRYAPPGYEDEITGYLNPRNVWFEVFFAVNGVFTVTEDDDVVDPETAERLSSGAVSGKQMNPFLQDYYIDYQGRLIRNDVDDVVLSAIDRPRLEFVPGLVFPRFRTGGIFKPMWQPSRLSRLFPEKAVAFTTLNPGINSDPENGDPGVYAFLRLIKSPETQGEEGGIVAASTYNKPVGVIGNPAFGRIDNLTDAVARERLPRARVWAYYPEGSQAVDDEFGTSTAGSAAVIIATPLPLKDFPIDPSSGLPDGTQLAANGGSLPDLSTGDMELSTPAWQGIDRANNITPALAAGRPDGTLLQLGDGSTGFTPPGAANNIYRNVYVQNVVAGCVIILGKEDESVLLGTEVLALEPGVLQGSPVSLERGDTIYVIPPTSRQEKSGGGNYSDPPTAEEMADVGSSMPTYRRGFDIAMRKRGGEFTDISFPSIQDPFFPVKEFLGQRSPAPLSTIEADVEFINTSTDPFEFPALRGEPTNDDGDFAIPYLGVTNTELDRLGAGSSNLLSLVVSNSASGVEAAYPDEIRINDGEILTAVSASGPPATLLTGTSLAPAFAPGDGTGQLRAYDLLLVERDQAAIPVSSQGIIHVGATDTGAGHVEPPRFVTKTREGDLIQYTLDNAMVYLGGGGATGAAITDTPAGPNRLITFDITSIPLVFSDGVTGTGGLNNLNTAGNELVIRLINPAGDVVETITIEFGGNLVSDVGGSTPISAILISDSFIILTVGSSVVAGAGSTWDFTLSIDAGVGGSTTAYIDEDRLTFIERVDLSSMRERGTVTANFVSVAAQLSVFGVTTGATSGVTINSPARVNDGQPFTFLSRTVGSDIVGTFTPASGPSVGDEEGSCKVMGWEGHGNIPFSSDLSGIRVAAMPTTGFDTGAALPTGTGTLPQANIIETSGLAGAGPGDLVTITESDTNNGTVFAGTYLIKHLVDGTGSLSLSVRAGGAGWAEVRFPRIIEFDEGGLTLTIDDEGEGPSGSAWAATGRVFVNVERRDPTEVVSMAYSALASGEFTLTTGTAESADGTGITDGEFFEQVRLGGKVSGMAYMKLGNYPNMPDNNVVASFGSITLANPELTGDASTHSISPTISVTATPPATRLGIIEGVKASPTVFQSDPDEVVYDGVPVWMVLSSISGAQWDTVHDASSGDTVGVTCLLPGDLLATNNALDADGSPSGAPGFTPTYGIYLEPSFPRPCRPLYAAVPPTRPLVVDAASAGATEPSADDVGTVDPSLWPAQGVTWSIRRARRWSPALSELNTDFSDLRYVYEIRRGVVGSYLGNILTASTPTQLGDFNDPDVNINPGDIVRLLDSSGVLVDTAEVRKVLTGNKLVLRDPGLTATVSPGDTYEVYLKTAPVPLEQSNEELYDLITDHVVFDRERVPNSEGGRVTDVNQLRDADAGLSFLDLGVQQGDIVVVDPAGELEGPGGPANPVERGVRPFGDVSVPGRPNHDASGTPSELDDNRGFYRVVSVTDDVVTVNPNTYFSGPAGSPVTYGTPGTTEYAVLPVISNGEGGGAEGQMDLRLTNVANGSDSYDTGDLRSIEPFSYRIIRPDSRFSEDTVDLVLFMRERLLSWQEEIGELTTGDKLGTYYIFQRDEHITDVGTGTAVTDGLGVPSNAYIFSTIGNVTASPFENVSDCLSILDRRFWILDFRLDSETPPAGGVPYATLGTGEGRPVLPDLLEEPLDLRDRFRTLRYAWLRFRTDRVDGSLQKAQRFEDELPRRQREQEEFILLQAGLDE